MGLAIMVERNEFRHSLADVRKKMEEFRIMLKILGRTNDMLYNAQMNSDSDDIADSLAEGRAYLNLARQAMGDRVTYLECEERRLSVVLGDCDAL